MMIGIIGGKLQGMEAVYLSKKAGFKTLVIDSCYDAPALSLADEGIVMDVTEDLGRTRVALSGCDAVLPANENLETLRFLTENRERLDAPLMFDMNAYEISCSKVRSNEIMSGLGVRMPGKWPECGYPVVVKPSGESGSTGVRKVNDLEELEESIRRIDELGDEHVVQEFVEGPNISLEVVGDGVNFIPLVITEVVLDDKYDCKMVRSPYVSNDTAMEDEFVSSSVKVAQSMGIRGIMDFEAIVKNGVPHMLEIDARIPSQTPAAVLNSHGVNMVRMLADVFVNDSLALNLSCRDVGAAFYEHVAVDDGVMRSCGEGVFSEVRAPRLVSGLFGSDEMMTDYEPGKKSWRATIICSGRNERSAWEKRTRCLLNIMEGAGIGKYIDPVPEGPR
jgi:pyrrolysine biosynthesis protein PylC